MNRKNLLLILIFLLIGFGIIYILNQKDAGGGTESTDEVKLYYSTKDAMYLKAEIRKIENYSNKYEATIKELINGPVSSDLTHTIPEGVKLLDIKIEGNRAILNFNRALVDNHWGGSTGEILTVYSIVNTITQFPEIETVRILIEGKEIETLAGHLDLSTDLSAAEGPVKK
ncbi:MAG: GerMN domain-containing protein [Halanaerobiaceae bacterium]|nr:GerMN domain-containing protein [Halanaerobiaceae bacterium]